MGPGKGGDTPYISLRTNCPPNKFLLDIHITHGVMVSLSSDIRLVTVKC